MTAATAYWVVAPGLGELRREVLPPSPAAGSIRVRTELSAVSCGTERLVGLGLVPAALSAAMACRAMGGDFGLPVKYGYCLVGEVVGGARAGQRVFTMHPHQDLADVVGGAVLELPAGLPAARAALIPNLETALNAVWDAEIAPGATVVVVGAGAVGLLIAYVVERLHALRPMLVEPDAGRRRLAASLPFVGQVVPPDELPRGAFAVAFHASGSGAGLQLALDGVGFEGKVLDLSWYGTQRVTLDLGGSFHAQRKQILACQVGTIARSKRATHGPRERLHDVLALLAGQPGEALDALLGEPVAFTAMPELMRAVYAGKAGAIVPLVLYGDAR
jgi:threonine dehydrogenase-like Zn-dependent dehydrogenase